MKNLNLNYNQNAKYIYFFTIFLIIFRKYLSLIYINIMNVSNPFINIVFLLLMSLLMIQVLLQNFNRRDILIIFIAALTFIFKGENSILTYVLLAFVAIDIQDEEIVKVYLYVSLSLFVLFIIGSALGIIPNDGVITYRNINGVDIPRGDFNFGNPNGPFMYLLPIYTAYIYIRYDNINIYDKLLILVSSIFIYYHTNSRTGFISIIVGLVIIEILKYINLENKYIKNIIIGTPIIIFLLSFIVGTFLYDSNILNSILSGRPSAWSAYLTYNNTIIVSIFGNLYPENIKLYFPLDNSYVYILAYLGGLISILIMYVMSKGLKIVLEKKDSKLLICILIILIYAFFEDIIFDVPTNFTFIFIIKYYLNLNKPRDLNLIKLLKYKRKEN